MPEPSSTFGLRALVRGVPAAVWAVTALFGVLLALHTVLTPLYRAPDEARHVDTVLSLREGRGYPPPGRAVLSQEVLGSYRAAGYAQEGPKGIGVPDPRTDIRAPLPLRREAAPDLAAAPAYRDVPALQRPVAQLNQMTQHPPLYYAVGAAVLWLVPGDADLPFPYVIGILRLLSVLCVAPLPLLAFAAARRLLGEGPSAVAASAVPLAVPQLGHIAGSVSNDNLLTGLFALLTVALVHVALGDLSRRTAVLVGLVTAAALLTKAFALAALPCLVAAYAVALLRTRSRRAVGGAIIALAVSALGGWWYVVNLLRYGTLQSEQTISAAYKHAPDGFSPSVGAYASELAGKVSTRFWGEFGYLEVPLPSSFTTTASLVLLALLAVGLLVTRPRLPALLLLLPALGIGAVMVAGTYRLYATYAIFPGMQGRYLFPALTALAVLVGSALGTVLGRAAPVVALLLALTSHLYGVSVLLDQFWGGSLRAVAAWAWWPSWFAYLLMGAVVAAAAGALSLLTLPVVRLVPAPAEAVA